MPRHPGPFASPAMACRPSSVPDTPDALARCGVFRTLEDPAPRAQARRPGRRRFVGSRHERVRRHRGRCGPRGAARGDPPRGGRTRRRRPRGRGRRGRAGAHRRRRRIPPRSRLPCAEPGLSRDPALGRRRRAGAAAFPRGGRRATRRPGGAARAPAAASVVAGRDAGERTRAADGCPRPGSVGGSDRPDRPGGEDRRRPRSRRGVGPGGPARTPAGGRARTLPGRRARRRPTGDLRRVRPPAHPQLRARAPGRSRRGHRRPPRAARRRRPASGSRHPPVAPRWSRPGGERTAGMWASRVRMP